MGWCSGTDIFDGTVGTILSMGSNEVQHDIIEALVLALEDHDWDCQDESIYWKNEVVQKVFHELHPDWFEDEE